MSFDEWHNMALNRYIEVLNSKRYALYLAYNAGMERAAQIAEERGHLALPHVIREEIEHAHT